MDGKKSRLFAQDFLKHFELFFAKERYRGQIMDKPWTDLLGSWNGLLGSWKDLLGPWTGYPPSHRNRSYNINEIFS